MQHINKFVLIIQTLFPSLFFLSFGVRRGSHRDISLVIESELQAEHCVKAVEFTVTMWAESEDIICKVYCLSPGGEFSFFMLQGGRRNISNPGRKEVKRGE